MIKLADKRKHLGGDPSGVVSVCPPCQLNAPGTEYSPPPIPSRFLSISSATGFLYLPHSILSPSTPSRLRSSRIPLLSLGQGWVSGEPVVRAHATGTALFHVAQPTKSAILSVRLLPQQKGPFPVVLRKSIQRGKYVPALWPDVPGTENRLPPIP